MSRNRFTTFAAAAAFFGCFISTPAVAQDGLGSWNYGLEVYGWLPDIDMTTANGDEIDISISDILDNLDFTLQGTVFATKGNWSIFADGVYLDISPSGRQSVSKSRSIGRFGQLGADIDVDVDIDQKAFISTFGAGYRFYESQGTNLSLVGGVRYLHIDLDVDVKTEGNVELELRGEEFTREFERRTSIDESGSNWDAIIGLQGSTKINDDWTFLYYGDIGTGDSDYTWQASVGVSYAFENFDLTFRYRYMDFEFDSNAALDELTVSGPQVGIVFTF